MSQAVTVQTDAPRAVANRDFPQQLDSYEPQIRAALPAHIPVDRFKRVVLTAVNQNSDLLAADRKTLFNAAVKCASDGLVPDGREAALVVFGRVVQYMPMVRGLIKLARQSGEISTLSAHIVRERDEFDYVLGDDERLHHRPALDGDAGPARLVYATVVFKDGSKQREIMTKAEVEKVRAVSRSKGNGPWAQWWDEMARKTVIRRLLKYVTLSVDVQRALERDDEGEFETMKRSALAAVPSPDTRAAAMAEITGDEPEQADDTPEQLIETQQPEGVDWNTFLAQSRDDLAKVATTDALAALDIEVMAVMQERYAPEDTRRAWRTDVLEAQRRLPAARKR